MILVTSGCSFSDSEKVDLDAWPIHVRNYLGCEHYGLGLGCQGNGLIMRKALYKCVELLKTNRPEDLLVGIMWSGTDRFDFYSEDIGNLKNVDGWAVNPTKFIADDTGGWVILNHHWTTKLAKTYYKNFHNETYGYWLTLEYILHTQWFLERHNIRYFMLTFTDQVLPNWLRENSQLNWLFEQIDLTKFADPYGCMNWCISNTDGPHPSGMFHPTEEQHKQYTARVIIPHLQKHGIMPQRHQK